MVGRMGLPVVLFPLELVLELLLELLKLHFEFVLRLSCNLINQREFFLPFFFLLLSSS
jgi:hypothetical protein